MSVFELRKSVGGSALRDGDALRGAEAPGPAESTAGLLPKFRLEVAWGNDPLDTPGAGEWTDETSYLRHVSTDRGRSNELESYPAGTCDIVLDDRTRRFDPHNVASALYPNVKRRKRVRVTASHDDLDETAVSFPGAHLSYVTRSGHVVFPSDAFTFECWLTGHGAASGDNSSEYVLHYLVGSAHVTFRDLRSLKIKIAGGTETNTAVDVLGDKSFARHLAIAWRTDDDMLAVYVDGALRFLGTYAATAITSGGTSLTLGSDQSGAAATLKGTMRDVRLWDIARTQHAIYSDMYRTLAGTETGLVSWWPMNEGSGPTVADNAGNNDLTLNGSTSWGEQAGDRPVYTGFIESITPHYIQNRGAEQHIRCTDSLALLARVKPRLSPYRKTVLDHSPVLYWPLDEASGPAKDISGNGNNGTYSGVDRAEEAPFPRGDTGLASHFSPGDTVRAASASVAQFDRLEPFSVSCIIGKVAESSSSKSIIGNIDATGRGWRLFVRDDSKGISGRLTNTATTNELQEDGYRVIDDGDFHHVAMTYDGTSDQQSIDLYVDGVRIASMAPTNTLTSTIESATNLFKVGSLGTGLDIIIGHVAVFAAKLSATQVKEQYLAAFRPWALQRSDVRVGKHLDLLGVAASERDLRRGVATLDMVREPLGQAIVDAQEVAKLEVSGLWVRADGLIAFDDRYASGYDTALTLTLGEAAGELGYKAIDLPTDDFDLATEVTTQRTPDGKEFVATDDDAEDEYSPSTHSIEGPWSDDEQPRDVGELVLEWMTETGVRAESIEIDEQPASWADIIRFELARQRVTLQRRPPGAGAAITEESVLSRISWDVAPRSVRVVVGLLPDHGSRSDYAVIGRSAVDGTAKLA